MAGGKGVTTSSNSNSSNNSDMHAYLMDRAKKSLGSGDACMAKSWLLTCSVLFPRSFLLQYDRYQIAKQEGNVTEAVTCLCDLLQNPEGDDYPELKQEKRAMVDVVRFQEDEDSGGGSPSGRVRQVKRCSVVRSGSGSGSCTSPVSSVDPGTQSFLRSVFAGLAPAFQHKILMSVARQEDGSWFDLCQLLLTILRTFPADVKTEGRKLVQQIERATAADPRNHLVYQQMLLFDVLPILFGPQSDLVFADPTELRSHLMALFSYLTRHSCIRDPEADEDQVLEQRVTEIVALVFQRMGWDTGLVDGGMDESIDVSLIKLTAMFDRCIGSSSSVIRVKEEAVAVSDAPMDLSVPAKKQKTSHAPPAASVVPPLDPMKQLHLLTASCLLFLRSLVRYARESRSSQSVLIEVSAESAAGGNGPKTKIIPHHCSSNSGMHSLPDLIVKTPEEQRLRSAFLTCVRTIELMVSPVGMDGGLVQQFFAMLKETGAEESSAYQDLRRDACFFKGQHGDFVSQTLACLPHAATPVKQLVQLIAASLIVHDHESAVQHAIVAVQKLAQLPPGSADSSSSGQEWEEEGEAAAGMTSTLR